MAAEPAVNDDKDETDAPPEAKPRGSIISTILGFVIITAVACGGGGLLGLQAYSMIQAEAKKLSETKTEKGDGEYSGAIAVKAIPPVITNLANPPSVFLRIEASVIFDGEMPADADALATQISGDSLAFLRTLSLAQIEGASGLLHLREDLTERAKLRSDGRVKEFIIQALAVE
jgi:flagellar protein FliL